MKRSFSLATYLGYARGRAPDIDLPLPDRDPGPVVWAHASTAPDGRALSGLCARLRHQRPDASIILTGDANPAADMMHLPLPPEHPASCERFAARLRPTVTLWSGHELRPALLDAMARHSGRLIALNLRDEIFDTPGPRWLPDPAPSTLALFHPIHGVDEASLRRLRRMGIPNDQLRNSGHLMHAAPPLEFAEQPYDEIAGLLVGRPIWLGAHLRGNEADAVLSAHQRVVRLAHRLLLIVVPATDEDADGVLRATKASGLRCCYWDQGETPDENTQVLVLEGPELMGLWHRLAPLTFLGSSLIAGHGGVDPFDAATMGTAILYGPNVGRHLASYSRLVEAGGARIVRDADSLASAVSYLVAPDQAAAMAHAGWEVVSRGTSLVDGLLQEIGTALDNRAKGLL